MNNSVTRQARRNFLKTGLSLGAGFACMNGFGNTDRDNSVSYADSLYVIGPMEGYSPHIGVLVSMLNYNRNTIIQLTKSMSVADLDYLHDAKSNTIGALIMHLGATEKWYQINSFEGRNELTKEEAKLWEDAMNLGDAGRKNIKGKEAKYYLDLIAEGREKTLAEFKKRDDKWLLALDPAFSKDQKFNTYWKWFHVCEHESNHRGQISWIKGRLPGAKAGNE